MQQSPLISVIIPVFNADKYLLECLDSVLHQSYKNLQIIIVDDGSSDNSRQIEDDIRCDERVTLIQKENGGVSAARNIGLQYAKGEYVYFLDADDVLCLDAMEKGMKSFADGVDLVEFSYLQMSESGDVLKIQQVPADDFQLKHEEFIESLFYNTASAPYYYGSLDYQGYLWNKIFKLNIIRDHNICFKEDIVYNEDCLFILEYMLHADQCVYLRDVLYHYRINSTGAMGRAKTVNTETVRRRCTQLEVYKRCSAMLKEQGNREAFRGAVIEGWDKSKGVYLSAFMVCRDFRIHIEQYIRYFGTILSEDEDYRMITKERVRFIVAHPRVWAYMRKIENKLKRR